MNYVNHNTRKCVQYVQYLIIFIKGRKGDKIQTQLLYAEKSFGRVQYLIELKENVVAKCYNRLVFD